MSPYPTDLDIDQRPVWPWIVAAVLIGLLCALAFLIAWENRDAPATHPAYVPPEPT